MTKPLDSSAAAAANRLRPHHPAGVQLSWISLAQCASLSTTPTPPQVRFRSINSTFAGNRVNGVTHKIPLACVQAARIPNEHCRRPLQ